MDDNVQYNILFYCDSQWLLHWTNHSKPSRCTGICEVKTMMSFRICLWSNSFVLRSVLACEVMKQKKWNIFMLDAHVQSALLSPTSTEMTFLCSAYIKYPINRKCSCTLQYILTKSSAGACLSQCVMRKFTGEKQNLYFTFKVHWILFRKENVWICSFF